MSPRPFEQHRITLEDGAQLAVTLQGPVGARPLLLLHGGLGCSFDWHAWLPVLGEQFRVVRLDARGHGLSTRGQGPLTYPRMAADVLRVLEVLGLEAVTILGFSDGGIVGYWLALHHPDRVTALATIGAQWRLLPGDPVRERLASVTPSLWRTWFPEDVQRYEATNPEPDFDALVKAVVDMWLEASGYPGEVLASLNVPLMLLRGAEDVLFSASEQAALATLVPQALHAEVPGAGHGDLFAQVEAFLDPVLSFLEANPHSPRSGPAKGAAMHPKRGLHVPDHR